MKHNLLRFMAGCGLLAALAGGTTSSLNPARFDRANISSPDFFPILPWDPHDGWQKPLAPTTPDGIESIAACNFNLAGFVLPKDLPRCEQLGLGALVLPSKLAFTLFKYTREWRELSDAEIDRRVKAMVAAAGSSPAIAGYFIMDEPGVRDFPALGRAVAAVKKYAPDKLAYINLFPNYATIGAPAPAEDLPLLPGKFIASVACATPLMVGEFRGPAGQTYVMIVNLSLEKSAKVKLQTTQPLGNIRLVSPMDGTLSRFDEKDGCWLTAGQGVLLALHR